MKKAVSMVTRKELAGIISDLRGDEVNVDQIRRNGHRWGLKPERLNQRVIRYNLAASLTALRASGVVPGAAALAATAAT